MVKEIKFKTDKGEFILVDDVGDVSKLIPWDFVEKSYNMKIITEDEARDIVDNSVFIFTPGEMVEYNHLYKDYITDKLSWNFSAKECLMSLLESLGIYLYNNPNRKFSLYDSRNGTGWYELEEEDKVTELYEKSEKLTFYNPVILKLS